MALPTLTGVGRLTADPELRFTGSGKAVADIRLAFNSRRLNPQTNQWEDGDVMYVRGSCWERLAENAAETLERGMEILVTGELRTESWEKDGQKHERTALLIRSIAPNLAFATAKVTKSTPGQNGGQGGAQRPAQGQQGRAQQSRPSQPPADDPWAVDAAQGYTKQPQGQQGRQGGYSDEPPF
ncbi:single-stranded DNA-binding protein [[Kitasatospora] papulosa]|uniref:single-stranded DNA-binding protein n=1 Tax=Streptomyces TaxID=1883 RepID=UPI00332A039C